MLTWPWFDFGNWYILWKLFISLDIPIQNCTGFEKYVLKLFRFRLCVFLHPPFFFVNMDVYFFIFFLIWLRVYKSCWFFKRIYSLLINSVFFVCFIFYWFQPWVFYFLANSYFGCDIYFFFSSDWASRCAVNLPIQVNKRSPPDFILT